MKRNFSEQKYHDSSEYEGGGRAEYPEVPMDGRRQEITETIRNNENAVIVGETGSGKTTRIPDFLMEEFPDAKIAITQPRRVAARSVAKYVAERRGQSVGQEVGYQVRFDDQTTEGTKANFMTDGILLRKLQFDPLLEEFDVVMVDEAHERNLNVDFVLGLLKRVQAERKSQGKKDLKVVVTSATIEKEKFAKFFGECPTVEVEGRMYPVDVQYEKEHVYDYTQKAAEKVAEIVRSGEQGDILIFMPGEREIDMTIKQINKLNLQGIEVLPLFGSMAPEDQDKIFSKIRKRKVIVSTNIAETSVTIDGVRHVIDSGVINQKEFNPETGIEALKEKQHAKSGCEQRKGRAGRTAPGKCHRLYTKEDYESRKAFQTPEIARSDLSHVILAMKKMGIDDVRSFEFIDMPDKESFSHAIETLKVLGALDENEKLTEIGEKMAELPLKPELAKMVLEAEKFKCVGSICTVVALIGGKPVFARPKGKEDEADTAHRKFKKSGSDFLTNLEVWRQWAESGFNERWARDNFLNARQLAEAREIRSQLVRELGRLDISAKDENGGKDSVPKCITAGLIQNLMVAGRRHRYSKVANGGGDAIFIHPSSLAFGNSPDMMIGFDIATTTKTFARKCQAVDPQWLPDIAPQILRGQSSEIGYDAQKDEVFRETGYALKNRYETIARKREKLDDEQARAEEFAKAFARGQVNLPSREHNQQQLWILSQLNSRSGGMVKAPDLLDWYKEKLAGASSKKEAEQFDDKLKMGFSDFCPKEVLEEINQLYPETIYVKGQNLAVSYEFMPGNPQYHSSEVFKATISIPEDMIFQVEQSDFPEIGKNGRPEIVFRCGNYNVVIGSSLEKIKDKIDKKNIDEAWYAFRRPDQVPVKADLLQPLPSLESLGAGPIAYSKDRNGQDILAYPAIATEQRYDSNRGDYVYVYFVNYYKSAEEAKMVADRTGERKASEDKKEQEKIERDALYAPVKEKYNSVRLAMENLESNYSDKGFDYESFYGLKAKFREASRNIDYKENLKETGEILDEIEREISTRAENAQRDRENRLQKKAELVTKMDELSALVGELDSDNYRDFGLSYDQFDRIRDSWELAGRGLNAEIPSKVVLDRAQKYLDEVKALLFEGKKKEQEVQRSPEEAFKALQDKFAKKPKSAKPQVEQKNGGSGRGKTEQSKEAEKMTEELRSGLLEKLEHARIIINSVAKTEKPDAKAPNASKIIKVIDRAQEARNDWKKVNEEVKDSENYGTMQGKVLEMTRRAKKVAEEMAYFEGLNGKWTEDFEVLVERAKEISSASSLEITPEILRKISPAIIKIAKSVSKPNNIDELLEMAILEAS